MWRIILALIDDHEFIGLIERLEISFQLAKTIDGFLIPLEASIPVMEKIALHEKRDAKDVLEEVLLHPRIKGYTSLIACCREVIIGLTTTPRFRGLGKYSEKLIQILENFECKEPSRIECGVPEPTWKKQYYPTIRGPESHKVPVKVERRRRLERGDLLAYGFLAFLALLNIIVYLLSH